ncbi:hypothetical protein EFK50_09810 [Nocardioides marmoriginsengisoli]|uniref:Uncharacterized protein n=1 Tax=Nocardioides marmoriginsengisoli TaxID=661483 RepID=A0A3N0CF89_9ACTN|nr:Imm8 family immunity protein [Nocardioides marmoriginsengisoli]RNL62098.1 hypothetical protein EFK50_09810 [Nocardioides marmoriginsengisoli]
MSEGRSSRTGDVHAVIHDIEVFDIHEPGDSGTEGGCFCYEVTATVGHVGSRGGDHFIVRVCSPKYVANHWQEVKGMWGLVPMVKGDGEVVSGTGLWLTEQWDEDAVTEAIRALVARSSPGSTWAEIGARIGRSTTWEFEYYRD